MDAQQIQGLIMPIGILVIFYFFVIRPQKKREKEIQQMREEIKVGDKIVTIG
ncbi:MAG TPA: preprotein translocase subunit YajC, partial [Tissierellaceae bacterium]